MVKRGPCVRPQASEGEAQHGPFCWTGRIGQGDERLHCGWHGQDHSGSEGGERTRVLLAVLKNPAYHFKRIGLEAGPLSQWLFSALGEANLPVVCEIDRNGRISRCGDEMMRVMLYEAAQSMLRSKKWSWLKAWAMQIARRRGMKKAIVALARRLAVIMHRIWVDGTEFHWTREATAAA